MKSVTIIIVTYQSEQWLPTLLASLAQLQPQAQEIIFIDNNSQDQTITLLEKFQNDHQYVHVIKNKTNEWFSKAVNQGIALSKSELVLLLNPDAILTSTSLSQLSLPFEQDVQVGAVYGKLMRDKKILDAFGIACSRRRQFYNRGEGQMDTGMFDTQDTFGFTGGCIVLLKKALLDIAVQGEILDEDFEAYKDDVDLSYRLRLRGWKILGIPHIIGQHQRTIDSGQAQSDLAKGRNRNRFSPQIRLFSTRNHLWCLIKNEPLSSLLLDLPWIAWYEFKKFGYILLTDPKTLKAYMQFLQGLPNMIHKRHQIQTRRLITGKQIRAICRM